MPIYFSVIIKLLFVCLHFFVNSDRLFDKIYLWRDLIINKKRYAL